MKKKKTKASGYHSKGSDITLRYAIKSTDWNESEDPIRVHHLKSIYIHKIYSDSFPHSTILKENRIKKKKREKEIEGTYLP